MHLGGIVLSAMHMGRERRHAPPEKGKEWVEANGGGDRRENGISHLLSQFSRGALVTVLLLVAAYAGWLSKGWVEHVNAGIARIAAVETLSAVTAAGQVALRVEIVEWRAEDRQKWIDQIEQYKWWANLEGDRSRAHDLEVKLEALKAKPMGDKP